MLIGELRIRFFTCEDTKDQIKSYDKKAKMDNIEVWVVKNWNES